MAELGDAPDRYAHLRARAARRKQETVERVRQGIATLQAAARPVTAQALREVAGLDMTAIRRNPEAYALFRESSAFLQRQSKRGGRGGRSAGLGAPVSADPLARYPKQRLIRLIRELQEALAAREALEGQYRALLQEHARCALTIERLREEARELEEYRGLLRGLRARVEGQEHGGVA
jgi:hypothetical protein